MRTVTTKGGPAAVRLAAAALACGALLAGCADEQQEIRSWMQAQRSTAPTIREKIEPPKKTEPFRYENDGKANPFAQSRLANGGAPVPPSGVQPDMKRRREALEGFPLDAIRMVGHMSNGQKNFALLQADNMVYQARVGNYAGQNFGVITQVTESEVQLKELVQDAAGDWTQRDTALRLQESKMGETKK